ncbi:DUF2064 domain-containing protein [Nocardiopsis sp. ARC36]
MTGHRDAALPTGAATLVVIAKEPVPGLVKTRLTPEYTREEAAALAEAALADTLHTVRSLPARRRLLVLEGRPGPWLPSPGFEVVPQVGAGLDERLAHAFAACSGPTLLIGMDTPQVSRALLAPALAPDAWDRADAWFGPSEDGGFWALGLAAPTPLCCAASRCRPRTRAGSSASGSSARDCAWATWRGSPTSTPRATPPSWRR